MEKFLEKMADIFDVDIVKLDDVIQDFEEFDSLSMLNIIAYANTEYKKAINAQDIKNCVTIKDLYEIIKK